MRKLRVLSALLVATVLGACDDELLDLLPQDRIAQGNAIVDVPSADAALLGAYSALQVEEYYGTDFVIWTDLLTDDVEHTGTFGSYGEGDLLNLRADNGVVGGMWDASYDGINRVNQLIERVPGLADAPQEDKDRILGQAYALRALQYFDLVRAYGDVPLILMSPATLTEASEQARTLTRTPAADVYAQVESDLGEASTRLAAAGVTNDDRTLVTPGFLDALRAKVHLYQEEWAEAEAAALAVAGTGDYALAPSYGALFDAEGAPTTEDVFRVEFTSTDQNNFGYYYQFAGRFEVGATQEIYDLFDPADERFAQTFGDVRSDGIEVVKYPTTTGTENTHVLRYADLLLILAEAQAQQDKLAEAAANLNQVRTRAGLAGYDLGADLDDMRADVLAAIYEERRLELAFEGHRWFDLVRSGRAASEIGPSFEEYYKLLPIPVSELDVAPKLTQNPGY